MPELAAEAAPPFVALRIAQTREEAAGFKTFVLEPLVPGSISYEAGQYLTFVKPGRQQEERRSYSLLSAPVLEEPLAIGVKRVDNGFFSRYLVDEAQAGDILMTTGVAGFFTLPADLSPFRQVFFLAAGSGITPVLALLKTVLHMHPELQAVLIYSNHSPEETAYLHELTALQTRFPDRFRLELLFSTSADLFRAHLHRDLLLQLLRQHAAAAPAQLLCYLCGPLPYMRMCFYALRQAGVPAEQIRKENFSTEKVVTPLLPPDTDPHQVLIRLRGREQVLTVQYPETILQTAKKAQLLLPYSCEAGRCGNCAARCTKGQVWLSYNEVLTEKELAQSLTLTCVGYPVGGDVELEIK